MKKCKQLLSVVLALVLCLGLCTPALAYGDMGKAGEYTIISVGATHTAAIDENGTLWTWGYNASGQLGNGTTESSSVPVKVIDNVAAVSCGDGFSASLKADGSLWMWGSNSSGQLGNGTTENSSVPVKVMDNVAAISCGGGYTAAIKTDGSLWMWGSNWAGQLGNGGTAQSLIPVKVMDSVAAVSCGNGFTAAVKTDSSLWMWGFNNNGELGNGRTTDISTPVKVMDNVAAVSCGFDHTAAVKTDGTLWTWGGNSYGQLGNGRTSYSANSTPVKVMDNVAAVSCGQSSTAAVKTDGTLLTWGWNYAGQLGNGTTSNSSTPVTVMYDVAAVSSNTHIIALKTDGTLWTWGLNSTDQLGNGGTGNDTYLNTVTIQTVPIQITLGILAVRLELNGGTGISTLLVKEGETLTVPTNPTKEGYTFGGWYTDKELTKPFNFNNSVTKGFTLYAKWVTVSSNAESTGRSNQIITLNGNTITLDAYRLLTDNGGEVTYVKLRDIAVLLENTGAQFNVDWRNGAIYVSTGTPYTTRNGTELKPIPGTDGSYKWNTAPVLIDGVTTALEGIVITDGNDGDHTFFKIRDLGAALGFLVDWSPERGIYIETN